MTVNNVIPVSKVSFSFRCSEHDFQSTVEATPLTSDSEVATAQISVLDLIHYSHSTTDDQIQKDHGLKFAKPSKHVIRLFTNKVPHGSPLIYG